MDTQEQNPTLIYRLEAVDEQNYCQKTYKDVAYSSLARAVFSARNIVEEMYAICKEENGYNLSKIQSSKKGDFIYFTIKEEWSNDENKVKLGVRIKTLKLI